MPDSPAPGATDFVHVVETDQAERLLRLGLAVLAAASMGRSSSVLLLARPLRLFATAAAGSPSLGPPLAAEVLAALPTPWAALSEAASLAPVLVCTCDTERALAGLEATPAGCDLVSLTSFWRAAAGHAVVVW